LKAFASFGIPVVGIGVLALASVQLAIRVNICTFKSPQSRAFNGEATIGIFRLFRKTVHGDEVRVKVVDASVELAIGIDSRVGPVGQVDERDLVVKEEAGVGAQREGSAGRVQVAGYATLDRVFLEIVRDGESLA